MTELLFPPLLPLIWMALCRWRPVCSPWALLAVASALALLAWMAIGCTDAGVSGRLSLLPVLGVGLRLDGVAALMLGLTWLLITGGGLHAWGFLEAELAFRQRRRFWCCLALLWGGLNLVWLASDLLLLFMGLELVAVAVVLLIQLRPGAATRAAARGYLIVVLSGAPVLVLAGFVLFVGSGSLTLRELEPADSSLLQMAALLVTAGLVGRAALFPLHTWLPPAHGAAEPPISALLSALVTKASFYSLFRFWHESGLNAPFWLVMLLGVLGALAIAWGGWKAWCEPRLKMLVAWSSVNQLGYLFLVFPIVAAASVAMAPMARAGVFVFVLNHALAKAALFMAAGNLIRAMGAGGVRDLGGTGQRIPVSLLSFGLAGVAIMGLPPSGGFAAKWLLLETSLDSGQWWWTAVIAGGGLVSAAYIFRVYRQTYLTEGEALVLTPPPRALEVMPMLLALMAAGMGLFLSPILQLMGLPGPGEGTP
ncbi:hydrogenase 4 subunit B [Halovibrio salipaludis]|uniref:Hydrogenase 4 subunit B n=1 Tax=Halovibrio salipaludis TaxID=2032626 RepID=A0A2A2FBE4_9GAMM|nr:proton-conducting transporter membrane subunit [Halovibrio salipaludis]PAU81932.1 hydrogenase 4 subunit B [Halovibrio salipaludis]